jgi:hypothetical protein
VSYLYKLSFLFIFLLGTLACENTKKKEEKAKNERTQKIIQAISSFEVKRSRKDAYNNINRIEVLLDSKEPLLEGINSTNIFLNIENTPNPQVFDFSQGTFDAHEELKAQLQCLESSCSSFDIELSHSEINSITLKRRSFEILSDDPLSPVALEADGDVAPANLGQGAHLLNARLSKDLLSDTISLQQNETKVFLIYDHIEESNYHALRIHAYIPKTTGMYLSINDFDNLNNTLQTDPELEDFDYKVISITGRMSAKSNLEVTRSFTKQTDRTNTYDPNHLFTKHKKSENWKSTISSLSHKTLPNKGDSFHLLLLWGNDYINNVEEVYLRNLSLKGSLNPVNEKSFKEIPRLYRF